MKRLTENIIFNSEHLSQDLARKSVRGGVTTMTAQGIQFVLNLAGTMVLARLLTPNDYGLIGMVTVIVNFAAMFKDAGLSMATVQKENISREQISTLFWLNVLISVFLGLCVLAGSPLVAWFYGRPELTAVTAALSLSFIISGLMIQHQALLRRHMQFGILALIGITSCIFNIIVAILLALAGFRYWALVGGTLTTALSGILLTFYFCPWIPGRIRRGSGIRGMLKFGGHLTGFDFVNYFARNADNMLIGKFIGADALGLYAKAYQLFMLPISQIRAPLNAVATPALSKLQKNNAKYKSYYLKLISIMSFITMPMMVFLFVCADDIINILLGKQWSGAVIIFKILCIAAFIQPVSTTWGLVLISLGQSSKYFKWGIINSIIIVISFIYGLPWGAVGVSFGYTAATYILLIPTLWYCFKETPVTLKDFFSAISRPAFCSIIMGVIIYLSQTLMINTSNSTSTVICFIAGILVYLLVLFIAPGGFHLLKEIASYHSLLFHKNL